MKLVHILDRFYYRKNFVNNALRPFGNANVGATINTRM